MSEIKFVPWKIADALVSGSFSKSTIKVRKVVIDEEILYNPLTTLVNFDHTLLSKDSGDAGLDVLATMLPLYSP